MKIPWAPYPKRASSSYISQAIYCDGGCLTRSGHGLIRDFTGCLPGFTRSSAPSPVPSSIVPLESNYLLNPQHPDFNQIKLTFFNPI